MSYSHDANVQFLGNRLEFFRRRVQRTQVSRHEHIATSKSSRVVEGEGEDETDPPFIANRPALRFIGRSEGQMQRKTSLFR